LAVVEDARTYLARIMDLLRVDLTVVARDFHADVGSDIAIREPHTDARLGRRRGEESNGSQDQKDMAETESGRTHRGKSRYAGVRFPGQALEYGVRPLLTDIRQKRSDPILDYASMGRVGTASRHSCIEVGTAPRAVLKVGLTTLGQPRLSGQLNPTRD
jgi:hypothetical protein